MLHCDLVLWEGQIGPREATARVLDPVLGLRMQAVQHEPHPDPGLRPGLGSGIGKLHGAAGQHDALIRASPDHRLDLRQVNKTGSEHSIEVSDGVR